MGDWLGPWGSTIFVGGQRSDSEASKTIGKGTLQAAQQFRHGRSKTTGNHLQGDDANLAFPLLNVRYVPSVHIQAHSHVGLSPSLPLSQQTDALPNLNQESVIGAGHPSMVAIPFKSCVWYARQPRKEGLPKPKKATRSNGRRTL